MTYMYMHTYMYANTYILHPEASGYMKYLQAVISDTEIQPATGVLGCYDEHCTVFC